MMNHSNKSYSRSVEPAGRSRRPTSTRWAWSTWALLTIHLGLFLAEQSHLGPLLATGHMEPEAVFQQLQVWRLVTGGLLLGNSWASELASLVFLWAFGRSLEPVYGSGNLFWLYWCALFFTSLIWGLGVVCLSDVGWNHTLTCAGAITGLAVSAWLYNCWFRLEVAGLVIRIPISLWLVVFYLMEYFSNVGFWPLGVIAHLAGCLVAVVHWQFDWRWDYLLQQWLQGWSRRQWFGWLLHQPKTATAANPRHPGADRDSELAGLSDDKFEQRLDEVLQKINLYGSDSLSKEEGKILQEASRRYRKRRRS